LETATYSPLPTPHSPLSYIAVAIEVRTFFNGPNDHVPVINIKALCPLPFAIKNRGTEGSTAFGMRSLNLHWIVEVTD
jgi:hypothetical protein